MDKGADMPNFECGCLGNGIKKKKGFLDEIQMNAIKERMGKGKYTQHKNLNM